MSTSTITVRRCDRCGAEANEEGDERSEWGWIGAGTRPGAPIIGNPPTPDDLCPGCIAQLKTWFSEVRSPVPPPPPPLAPLKRGFTLDERAVVHDFIEQLLREQFGFALQAFYDRPTDFLENSEPPAELFVGLDVRASKLAGFIADIMKRPGA